jgi:hypothetical protein
MAVRWARTCGSAQCRSSTMMRVGALRRQIGFHPELPMPSLFPAWPRRWVQLVLGLVVMMAISSPQYVWTLFVKPFS